MPFTWNRDYPGGGFDVAFGGGVPGSSVVLPTITGQADFSALSQQSFPTSATGVFPGRTASDIHLFEDTGNQTATVGGVTLTATNSPLTDRVATGLYNGTSMYYKKCVEIQRDASNGNGFEGPDNSTYDVTTGDFMELLVLRVLPGGGIRRVMSKINADGYMLTIGSNGRPTWRVDDGTSNQQITVVQDIGGYAPVPIVCGRSSGRVFCYLLNDYTDDAATATGSLTVAKPYVLGDTRSTGTDTAGVQYLYRARFEGAEAANFTQQELIDFWTHATSPSIIVDYARNSQVLTYCGTEAGFGARFACWNVDELSYGWEDGGDTPALHCDGASTNLLYGDLTDAAWTATNITVANLAGEAPDGTQESYSLTASANNGTAEQTVTTTASTRYTGVFLYRREGGSNVDFEVYAQRSDTSAELANTGTLTATDEWQIARLAVTTATTGTVIGFDIHTSGEGIRVWQPFFGVGLGHVLARTEGATADVAAATWTIDNTGQATLDSFQGEAVVSVVLPESPDRTMTLYEAIGVVDNTDKHSLAIAAADTLTFEVWDESAVSVGSATTTAHTWTSLTEVRARWQSDGDLPGHAGVNTDVLIDGSQTDGATATWTPSSDADDVYGVAEDDGSNPLSGTLVSLTFYDEPREDTP